MKLTKSKLNQLIREGLHDRRGGRGGTWIEQDLSPSEPGEEGGRARDEDSLASLTKEEKKLVEDMLDWWSKQIKDGSAFAELGRRLRSRRLYAVPLGFPLTAKHLKIIREALEGLAVREPKNPLVPKTAALALKIEAILSDAAPEVQEPEHEDSEEKKEQTLQDMWRDQLRRGDDDPQDPTVGPVDRFATLDYRNEALKGLREKKTMKITKTNLKQLILEELEEATSSAGLGGPRNPEEIGTFMAKSAAAQSDADEPADPEQKVLTVATLGDMLAKMASEQEGTVAGIIAKALADNFSRG